MKKVGLFLLFVLLLSMLPSIEAAPIEIKYFYSTGCSHCKATSAVLEDIQEHYGDLVNVDKININATSNQQIWNEYSFRFNIGGVPVIIINEDVKLEGDIKINYDDLVALIDELLLGIEVIGDGYYSDGIDAMGNGQFEDAINLFNDAIEIYEASKNQTKINLCNLKIQDCNNYMLAKEKFIEAENLYFEEEYESAKALYEEIIDIYNEIGNDTMASTSEVRLRSCNFFITYDKAGSEFERENWQMSMDFYEEAKAFTSNKETIDAINELISFCQSQVDATGFFDQAEYAYGSGEYAQAKQLYADASLLFSDADKVAECNDKISMCDSYILVANTYEYALTLYGDEDYEGAISSFENAKNQYLSLGEAEAVAQCDSYISDSQDKIDEIELQLQLEQEEREHQKFMKMVYVSIAAVSIIVFFSALILFSRRRRAATIDEPEYAAEDEEYEGESE